MPETAEILSRVMGRPARFVQTPIEDVHKWSSDFVTMLEWNDRIGNHVDIAALPRKYCIPPATLPRWAGRVNRLAKKAV